jgi:hypothetical protein
MLLFLQSLVILLRRLQDISWVFATTLFPFICKVLPIFETNLNSTFSHTAFEVCYRVCHELMATIWGKVTRYPQRLLFFTVVSTTDGTIKLSAYQKSLNCILSAFISTPSVYMTFRTWLQTIPWNCWDRNWVLLLKKIWCLGQIN